MTPEIYLCTRGCCSVLTSRPARDKVPQRRSHIYVDCIAFTKYDTRNSHVEPKNGKQNNSHCCCFTHFSLWSSPDDAAGSKSPVLLSHLLLTLYSLSRDNPGEAIFPCSFQNIFGQSLMYSYSIFHLPTFLPSIWHFVIP